MTESDIPRIERMQPLPTSSPPGWSAARRPSVVWLVVVAGAIIVSLLLRHFLRGDTGLKNLWWVGAVAAAGLLALLLLRSGRARRQVELKDSLNRLALAGSGLGPLGAEHGFASSDGTGSLDSVMDEPFPMEDEGSVPAATARSVPVEELPDLRRTEPAAGFEVGGDPLAEADFHIGYGMYEQAAQLLRYAIKEEPGRRDLRLKLLDVYFELGNRDEFLQLAGDLTHTRDHAAPGEWEKIAIMGRQIAPKDPVFSVSEDLNTVAGVTQVDYDLIVRGQDGRAGVDDRLGGQSLETVIEFSEASTSDRPVAGADQELSLGPVELAVESAKPATMSGIGTKLDLARAYLDIGDHEGARSILEEVLSKGSMAQKEKAQRLLDELSG
jgi:pilus assembly protein FimV